MPVNVEAGGRPGAVLAGDAVELEHEPVGVPVPSVILPAVGAHAPPSPFGNASATFSFTTPASAPLPVVPRNAPSASVSSQTPPGQAGLSSTVSVPRTTRRSPWGTPARRCR